MTCQVQKVLSVESFLFYDDIFKNLPNSSKVLRSHIEALPLPHWSEQEINQITGITDNILDCSINQNRRDDFLHKLDELVMLQWGLAKKDVILITKSLQKED